MLGNFDAHDAEGEQAGDEPARQFRRLNALARTWADLTTANSYTLSRKARTRCRGRRVFRRKAADLLRRSSGAPAQVKRGKRRQRVCVSVRDDGAA